MGRGMSEQSDFYRTLAEINELMRAIVTVTNDCPKCRQQLARLAARENPPPPGWPRR